MQRTLRSKARLPLLLSGLTLLAMQSGVWAQNVQLQAASPGTQQNGNLHIGGRGLFGSRVGIGTQSPQGGLHVHEEADALAGTLALEGDATTFMTFFPQGLAGGRKAYLGFPSPTSNSLFIGNETSNGHIMLTTGSLGSLGINATPGSHQMVSVYINRPNSYAVFADNGYTGSGSTYGVFGRTWAPSGMGLYGLSLATTGTGSGVRGRSDSPTGTGVYGSTTKTTGTNYGVYGYSGSPSGYALYGQGRFAATGTKSFVIDHPLDPENRTLAHYCTEGAEPLNVYEGNALLDDAGVAWIELPEYFSEINRDPRFSLTAIGAPMPGLHVANEVQDGRFQVAGGVAGAKVSWRVSAVRNDLFVREHGAPVEQEKPVELRGKYLSPELYGMPAERGVAYDPAPPEPQR
jgi:hypothetical protein